MRERRIKNSRHRIYCSRKTYNADTFDGEYHSCEETGQIAYRGKQFDVVDRLSIDADKDVVERDREAAYHEAVGQQRERHHVLEIAHLAEHQQSWSQRGDVQTYVYVRVGVEVRNLTCERKHDGFRQQKESTWWLMLEGLETKSQHGFTSRQEDACPRVNKGTSKS